MGVTMDEKPEIEKKNYLGISEEQMNKAIEAFPQSKLNRTSSNASMLRIPNKDERSDSTISISMVEKLRELRNRFATRTELLKAKAVEKAESTESEEEEETATDPTKTDVQEFQLDAPTGTGNDEVKVSWWKRYPGRKLIIRQPLCLSCIRPARKPFVVNPDLPLIQIVEPNQPVEPVKKTEESEAAEIIGQETVKLKEYTFTIPAWVFGLMKLFVLTISPYSIFYLIWAGLLALAVIYNFVSIPLREAFDMYDTEEYMEIWYSLNAFADLIYLCDILIVRPRLEFIEGGIVKIDMASFFPLDFFSFFYGKEVARFRILRILKVGAFWEAFEKLDQRLNAGYAVRLSRTVIYIILIIHIEACGYYGFNRWQGLQASSWSIPVESISPYVYSFYVCMKTATSIGSLPAATNPAEFLFMTSYWLSGIFVSAILIGQVIDILDSANANKVNYRKTMDATLSCMQHLHAPEHVINKVRTWFMYNWDQQKTFDENSLFESLPIKLKSDLAISVHFHTLSKVSLFQNCERALIYDMILKLKPVVFLPMDYICRKGEVGKEMYIVKSGMVEVVGGPNNSIVFVTLKEGSVFGEISLLALSGKNRRTADVRSKGFSTLFSLSKQDFEEIMKNYPQAHELLKKRSQRMLNRDKKKGKSEEQAKKEEKLKKSESLDDALEDDVVEVIPERPLTPRLLDAVVQALEVNYPGRATTVNLRRSWCPPHGDLRRLSTRRVSAFPRMVQSSSTVPDQSDDYGKSVNLAQTGQTCQSEEFNPKSNEQPNVGKQDQNNVPNQSEPKLYLIGEEDEEDENSPSTLDLADEEWIQMLAINRNPIKKISSYLPHIC